MIRLGKQQGWLSNDSIDFQSWAEANGASISGLKFATITNTSRSGVIATRPISGPKTLLMSVPRDLILSAERVGELARDNPCLQELFVATGDFGKVSFLANLALRVFQHGEQHRNFKIVADIVVIQQYIKYLPEEPLPTLWTDSEKVLLRGTTLLPAIEAKLKRLRHEYDGLRKSTCSLEWCQSYWWGESTGQLTYSDWLQIDAMYRSRAVKFPPTSSGRDCMIPCLDMLNHADPVIPTAYYKVDDDGNALLWLSTDCAVEEGNEVTINYGISRTACETLYSYGFIDEPMTSAKGLFLELDIPSDDPIGMLKRSISTIRGFRLSECSGQISWDSDFVWLLCANEEDGLCITPPNDDRKEPRIAWKGSDIDRTSGIRHLLELDKKMWDVYQLRATSLVQARIESQLRSLQEWNVEDLQYGTQSDIRKCCWYLLMRLRDLEHKLLLKANGEMKRTIRDLLASPSVQLFLDLQKI
ncbi:SET domain-containing protein [Cadophora sp. DSE1049]|nr:SET domain-containing protein [Cadophora sp. DSE1049]